MRDSRGPLRIEPNGPRAARIAQLFAVGLAIPIGVLRTEVGSPLVASVLEGAAEVVELASAYWIRMTESCDPRDVGAIGDLDHKLLQPMNLNVDEEDDENSHTADQFWSHQHFCLMKWRMA